MGKYYVIPEDGIQITETQRRMARAYYVRETGKKQRGQTSDEMIDFWFNAGSPEILVETPVSSVRKFGEGELRKFRAWLADNGHDFRELDAETRETLRNDWEEAGKPVPESFMDRDIVARVYALPIIDGKIDSTAGTDTFEVSREELRDVRGTRPGQPQISDYIEAIADKLEGFSPVRIVNAKGTEHRAQDGQWGTVRATQSKVLEEKDKENAELKARLAQMEALLEKMSAKMGD
jgi:hypothetical protein